MKFAKLYAPAVMLGAASIASILASHNIMKKRNVALAAAYAAVDKSFKDYRDRVIERFGEQVEKELRYNIKAQEIEETVTDDKGKEKKVKQNVNVAGENWDGSDYGPYAKVFDDTHSDWKQDPEMNLFYLRARQAQANDKQIFTPYNVCHFMALATMGNVAEQVEKSGFITVHDDCCGGGATLIAAANVARDDLEKAGFNFQNHILFSAQDIEETVALMCYIQLSLLGVAGFVKVGNSLTDPIRNGDSLENYWFTPMYFSDVWHTRRVVSQMMDILREERESNDH